MATEIIMPKWGLTMKEGKLVKWFKQEGEAVKAGENLFEVETDKITNSVECPADGTLFQILVPEGETVPVQAILGQIAAAGESPAKIAGGQVAAEGSSQKAEDPKPAEAPVAEKGKFVPATPAARKLAKQYGIELSQVKGSGPKGRVTEADVKGFHENPPQEAGPAISPQAKALADSAGLDISQIKGSGADGKITKIDVMRAINPKPAEGKSSASPAAIASSAEDKTMPMEGVRKLVADNMMASLHGSAQLTAFVELDATEMHNLRDKLRLKYKRDENFKLSYNDIICVAASRALLKHPLLNSTLEGNDIVMHGQVNLGMAVALDNGLIVPNIKNADQMGLLQMAKATRELAKGARKGGLSMDDIRGGTFTISNVSMLGVDGFTPILNPPETGILGVGRVVEKPAVHKGEIKIRKMMTLSLTFDHRVADGSPAMSFLRTLADYLEDPGMMLE